MLPKRLKAPLERHLAHNRVHLRNEVQNGRGCVQVPNALERKYPGIGQSWPWQRVFPARGYDSDAAVGRHFQHHYHETFMQKAMRTAVIAAGIEKHAGCHNSRHTCATHLLMRGSDSRTVRELLGRNDVKTTMISTHVLNRGGRGVTSPLDPFEGLHDARLHDRQKAARVFTGVNALGHYEAMWPYNALQRTSCSSPAMRDAKRRFD
jgi:integrase